MNYMKNSDLKIGDVLFKESESRFFIVTYIDGVNYPKTERLRDFIATNTIVDWGSNGKSIKEILDEEEADYISKHRVINAP